MAAFVAVQLILLLAFAPAYGAYGLRIDWSTAGPMAAAGLGLLGAWIYFQRYRHHPTKRATLDVVASTALVVTLTAIVAPAQYVAVAIGRPLVDAYLAAADAAMHVDVAALARWTAGHRALALVLALSYASLLPQLFLPPLLLGLKFRDRECLWEYVFHYHFCLITTLAALALFPAACAFQYYGVPSTFDQSRFIAHFSALRAGTFHVISLTNLEGLISMPSFHVAGGLIATWSFRRHRSVAAPLAILNAAMIAATFLSGAHYFVDVIASFALFAVSVAVHRVVDASARSRASSVCGLPVIATPRASMP
jgi:hypothetical protein